MKIKNRMLEDFDFVGGILAALVDHGKTYFRLGERTHDQLDLAFELSMEQAFEHLMELLQETDIEVGFRVKTHYLYGDSQTIRGALTFLAGSRLIRYDGPGFITQLDDRAIEHIFEENPVDRKTYEMLAREFTSHYYAPRLDRPHAYHRVGSQWTSIRSLKRTTNYLTAII